jgi:hypothetical protein
VISEVGEFKSVRVQRSSAGIHGNDCSEIRAGYTLQLCER